MRRLIVTGSSGLVGSECVRHFARQGWLVHGIDGNQRRDFFGPDGDTSTNLSRLRETVEHFTPHHADIRNRPAMDLLFQQVKPELVIHAAAQPSHDLASKRPVDDFEVNALGTLNLLEATRQHAPEAVFCFCSTNKVYGDAPNELPLIETATRWEFARPEDRWGISERMRVDRSRHSVFGASKLAADVMVQEYGRTFGLRTGVFRGGCLTGGAHAGAELHGFLAYLGRCAKEGRTYRVYGYKGKQVRDNLHAYDVARAFEEFAANPRPGEVYNLGGGRYNAISILEAIAEFEAATGKRLRWDYIDQPRGGDHICYYTDTSKLRAHYPGWSVTRGIDRIIQELCSSRLCEAV